MAGPDTPSSAEDDIPFPEDEPSAPRAAAAGEKDWALDAEETPLPEERLRAEPELEVDWPSAPAADTRPISQRAAPRGPSGPAASQDEYLKGLNAEQREAVLSTEEIGRAHV